SPRVSPIVEEQLLKMASNKESRLPQFAAIKALHRLNRLSPDLENVLRELDSAPEWRSVTEYVRK
ncbi:MAG: hypothetical protein KDA84_28820, partial [Planctomycetaceae bacterium]|nr:hypothetical protein [Planctomycetaceae bacterium]